MLHHNQPQTTDRVRIKKRTRKVVREHLVLERHDDAVAPQPHGAHLRLEAQLADALALVVVPDHHFVRGVLRRAAAADEREDVAAEEHLGHRHAAVGEAAAKLFFGMRGLLLLRWVLYTKLVAQAQTVCVHARVAHTHAQQRQSTCCKRNERHPPR